MIAVSKRSLNVKSFVDMCSRTPVPPSGDAVRRGSNGSSARPPDCHSRAVAGATTAAWPARVRRDPFRPVTLRVAAGHGSSAGHGPVVPCRMAHPAATCGAFIEWRPQGWAPPTAGAPSSTRPDTRKVAALRPGRSCRRERSRSRAPAGTAADECGSGREEAPRARGRAMVSGWPKIAEPAHSLAIKPSCESSITLSCFYPQ